jgi:hypothetical protein
MSHSTNKILASLPENERRVLQPLLSSGLLNQHHVIVDVRATITTVVFPFDAVVSLVIPLISGEVVETAMVGHDGVIGAGAVLNGRVSLNRAIVQLGGGGQHCEVNALRGVLSKCPVLHSLFARHEQVLFAHAQQSAACNATHDLESRLARWLLRARDLHGSDELHLTQEYLAEMLGVRRTSVSLVAHTLQNAGVLRYKRGNIHVTDVEALKEIACECYEAVNLSYQLLREPTNE